MITLFTEIKVLELLKTIFLVNKFVQLVNTVGERIGNKGSLMKDRKGDGMVNPFRKGIGIGNRTVLILAIYMGVYFLLTNFQGYIYENVVPINKDRDQWMGEFMITVYYALAISFVCVFLWVVVSAKFFRFTPRELKTRKYFRIWSWLLIATVIWPLVGTAAYLERPREGYFLVYFCVFVLSAMLPYLMASILFSPPGVKHIPLFASTIRRWW